MRTISLPWKEGVLKLCIRDDILVLEAENNKIEFRPRTIIVEKAAQVKEGVVGKKKYLYIVLLRELKPFNEKPYSRIITGKPLIIERYEIRYTRTGIGEYYTFVTPGTHLYDYIIVSEDEIGIAMSGKREVYVEEERLSCYIYLV